MILIVCLIGVVLPYWLWSKADPITQIPIPHASRDSYIQNINAGIPRAAMSARATLIQVPRGITPARVA
jgi:hypothetical protein